MAWSESPSAGDVPDMIYGRTTDFVNFTRDPRGHADWPVADGPVSAWREGDTLYLFSGKFVHTMQLSSGPRAREKDLVKLGSEWRFFRGRFPPSLPDRTAWRQPGFSDGHWESGEAGIGYGDDDDRTILNDMQDNYLTVYVRQTFSVADPASVVSLDLGINFDDGFVGYLNGEELYRFNAGDVGQEFDNDDRSTWDHEGGAVEVFDVSASIEDLVGGENLLAFEIHNWTIDSSDLSFDDRLTAQGIFYGPFLRGDCNGDFVVDLIDPLTLLFSHFGGASLPCRAAADSDGDGDTSSVGDAVYLLYFLYLSGPSPASPHPGCDLSTLSTDGDLGCETPPNPCL